MSTSNINLIQQRNRLWKVNGVYMIPEKRMAKDKRRQQLLNVACEIIRTEGTQKLSLALVAERSGVTKPVAYQHFGTKSGLLMALYRELGTEQAKALADALGSYLPAQVALADLTMLLSTAFVDCVLENGALYSAITAALVASAEMDEFRQEIRAEMIANYRDALALKSLPRRGNDLLFIGILGAAEALAESAARGTIKRDDAISTLSMLMVRALVD